MSEKRCLDNDLFLEVGFRDKDKAKRAGARPSFHPNGGGFKGWFIPKGMDVNPAKEWWPDEFKQEMGISTKEVVDESNSFSLSQVLGGVKKILENRFVDPVWVRAEVVSMSGGHHQYLELSDYDDSGSEKAKARGVIWASQKPMLDRFKRETGMALKGGVKVLCKAYIEFSERYGFSLRIVDIDSKFTIGDMEAKLLTIRATLKDEGIYDLNKLLHSPRDFTNVAVIAPEGAAGLGDFMTQAVLLIDHGLCKFKHFPAVFQGQNATQSMSRALDSVRHEVTETGQYDAVVIIRGGGDKAGLYALNEIELARRVCLMPIPVIVGVGHERDNTILDEISNMRSATPSLVISHIFGQICHNAKKARKDYTLIRSLSAEMLSKARLDCERANTSVKSLCQRQLTRARTDCERVDTQIKSLAKGQLTRARQLAEILMREIREEARHALILSRSQVKDLITAALYADPKGVIDRGYAVIRNEDGKVVGNKSELKDNITVQMRDGEVRARIEQS